ncbi:unnamed protein product [Lota lota]
MCVHQGAFVNVNLTPPVIHARRIDALKACSGPSGHASWTGLVGGALPRLLPALRSDLTPRHPCEPREPANLHWKPALEAMTTPQPHPPSCNACWTGDGEPLQPPNPNRPSLGDGAQLNHRYKQTSGLLCSCSDTGS